MKRLRIAWRNVWRNRRRSAITVAAVAANTAIMVIFWTLMDGWLEQSVRGATQMMAGEGQVHAADYRDDPSMYKTVPGASDLLAGIRDAGILAAPRRYGAGMLAHEQKSAGGQFWGVNPQAEHEAFDLADEIFLGDYLGPEPAGGVVLGQKLASILQVDIGDKVTAVVRTAGMAGDARLFTVIGIFNAVGEAVDRAAAVIHEDDFIDLFKMPGDAVHEIAFNSKGATPPEILAATVQEQADATWTALLETTTATLARAVTARRDSLADAFRDAPGATTEAELLDEGLGGYDEDFDIDLTQPPAATTDPWTEIKDTANPIFREAGVFVGLSDWNTLKDATAEVLAAHAEATDPDLQTALATRYRDSLPDLLGAPVAETWQEIMPTLAMMVELSGTGVAIFFVIFFLVAALSVMNTMLMATYERVREFGVLKALGAGPGRIVRDVIVETAVLGTFATAIGGVIAIAASLYFQAYGLDLSGIIGTTTYSMGIAIDPMWYAKMTVVGIVAPMVAMVIACVLAALYPGVVAARLDPVKAIHHH